MEEVSVPPPLPPKTRNSATATNDAAVAVAATVHVNTSPQVIGHGKPAAPASSVESSVIHGQSSYDSHVVTIRIAPNASPGSTEPLVIANDEGCIRISLNSDPDMVQKHSILTGVHHSQCSSSDTLDSGTCSDVDPSPGALPPLPKKRHSKSGGVSVTVISGSNSAESDDNESNLSCDSLNSSDLSASAGPGTPYPTPIISFLRLGMLKDIRNLSTKLSSISDNTRKLDNEESTQDITSQCNTQKPVVHESTYEERAQMNKIDAKSDQQRSYDDDRFYKFHLNENIINEDTAYVSPVQDECFAGYKDIRDYNAAATIRSEKGTIRGVKNRVRAGIVTFLQMNNMPKSYRERDAGKVVVYTTTMGILRDTYQKCMMVKKVLRTLLVKFEERDVFMSSDFQDEIRDRMNSETILVPQLFVDGVLIGDADVIERLNESGDLRRMLKPYKSINACTSCETCGGFRLVPCPVCCGSKKSVHRNDFTTKFIALKCMNCDEVGLVKCPSC